MQKNRQRKKKLWKQSLFKTPFFQFLLQEFMERLRNVFTHFSVSEYSTAVFFFLHVLWAKQRGNRVETARETPAGLFIKRVCISHIAWRLVRTCSRSSSKHTHRCRLALSLKISTFRTEMVTSEVCFGSGREEKKMALVQVLVLAELDPFQRKSVISLPIHVSNKPEI